jgi:hypothetical protein
MSFQREYVGPSVRALMDSPMLRCLAPGSRCSCFLGCLLLLFCCDLRAQQDCNVEVKILLAPGETPAVVAALRAKKETAGSVYFFDTDSLELLAQGAIVRLRRGAPNDLTVKFRPPNAEKFSAAALATNDLKCEQDLTGAGETPSYSITNPLSSEQFPQTGDDASQLFSAEQRKFLAAAHISIDWTRVKRLAEIASTDWQIRARPPLGKFTLELWEWPGGKVLELSTKVAADSASATYLQLQQLVKAKHLSLSHEQHVKTTIALESITRATAH